MNDSHSQESNRDLKILVCYHKPYQLPPKNEIFLPIHVGAAISTQNLNIQRDDQLNGQPCDNISAKNESYCELTAIYWAWKNLKKLCPDVKYVGLFHYRRFFDFNYDDVINSLNAGKIMLASRTVCEYPLKMQYCEGHISDDYRTLCKIIKEKFPDDYDDFINVMEKNNKISFFNMFIMKYEEFVNYCEWLFPILSATEANIPYQHYNSYQKRVFGFMAERLLNVYVHKRHMKVKYCDVYDYPSKPHKRSALKRVYDDVRRCRKNFVFMIMKPKLKWPFEEQ